MAIPPSKNVSDVEIRAIFNNGGYYERIKRGDYKLKQKKRPAPEHIQRVFGVGTLTVSTKAFDKETNELRIKTHHYESPEGHILVRNKITGIVQTDGKMDPKRLFHEGVVYHYEEGATDE